MRLALAALLAAHGIAHLPGFAVAWRLMTSAEIPYKTTLFGGAIEIGDTGARLIGAGWLLMAVVFLVLSGAAWANASWWRSGLVVAATTSALLSAAGWPEARIGLLANAVIIGILFAMPDNPAPERNLPRDRHAAAARAGTSAQRRCWNDFGSDHL